MHWRSCLTASLLVMAVFASCSNMYWAGGPYAATTVDADGRVGGVFGGGIMFGNTSTLPSMNVNASQVNNRVNIQQSQYQGQGNSQGQSQSFPSGDDDDDLDSSKHKHGHFNGHGHGNGQANGHSKNHPDD